ncbi:hypothetical protein CLU81_3584 [Flavobacterium sp. 9]|nr:hypothetical protein CLU81_3584 [Flavobacterium sp. 9]
MATVGKYGKIEFSEQDIQFIRENFQSMTNDQIASSLGLKKTRVRTLAYSMGLKRMDLEYWTSDQVDFLKQNYKSIGDVELAQIFENEWPKNKGWSKKHIEKKRRYLNLKRTKTELQKVHDRNKKSGRLAVANKKRWEFTGSNEIGTIVIWRVKDYPMAFIKTENGYVHYNRWLWKKEYGSIPEGYNVVKKSGCPEIPTIEFLELLTKDEHARRNQNKFLNLPADVKEIISLKNKLIKTIKKNENAT